MSSYRGRELGSRQCSQCEDRVGSGRRVPTYSRSFFLSAVSQAEVPCFAGDRENRVCSFAQFRRGFVGLGQVLRATLRAMLRARAESGSPEIAGVRRRFACSACSVVFGLVRRGSPVDGGWPVRDVRLCSALFDPGARWRRVAGSCGTGSEGRRWRSRRRQFVGLGRDLVGRLSLVSDTISLWRSDGDSEVC